MNQKLLSPNARLIEAILYLENEPQHVERLMRLTNLEKREVEDALSELQEYWATHMHGLELIESQEHYSFTPSFDLHQALRTAYGKKVDKRLSKAALETLAIIAYSQPVTRRDIENIRGVSSDGVIRILREREYISVVGKKQVPGYPSLFGTTKKFLFEFNLPSIGALPRLSDIDKERFSHSEELFDEH